MQELRWVSFRLLLWLQVRKNGISSQALDALDEDMDHREAHEDVGEAGCECGEFYADRPGDVENGIVDRPGVDDVGATYGVTPPTLHYGAGEESRNVRWKMEVSAASDSVKLSIAGAVAWTTIPAPAGANLPACHIQRDEAHLQGLLA